MNQKIISTYFDRLWPILRSITGEGVRKTHKILKEIIPLKTLEIPTGTKVHDWVVPEEWSVSDSYIIDPKGKKICDIKKNNLHILNYSTAINKTVSLKELNEHLHSIKELPNAIPYVTSYYGKNWGFCIQDKIRKKLKPGKYKVYNDAKHFNGSMTISEKVLKGKSKKEILFITYTCHPSLANNELSGPLATAFLYKKLSSLKKRYFTYRFVFHPETIGAVAYLSKKGKFLKKNVFAAYNLTCLGLKGSKTTYKRSRIGNSVSDLIAEKILNDKYKKDLKILDFYPSGSDERQYCSPGYNLPMGVIMRGVPNQYPEYHSSLDNKKKISIKILIEMINVYFSICKFFESADYKKILKNKDYKLKKKRDKKSEYYLSLNQYCEPNFTKRNLQGTIGASRKMQNETEAVRWLLSYSDGLHDLRFIAKKSGLNIKILQKKAKECCQKKILKKI